MCNRARNKDAAEPERLVTRFGADWLADRPMDNRFDPVEMRPAGRAYVIRRDDRGLGIDVARWDVLGRPPRQEMTNLRQLGLPRWLRLIEYPANRCLIPVSEFAEWTPDKIDLNDGKPPLKGEMWFGVTDQPTFAIAGLCQHTREGPGFAMVTCDPNELVAPIHPRAMVTILGPADHERWLCGDYDDAVALQRPYPAGQMIVRGPEFPTRSKSAAGG